MNTVLIRQFITRTLLLCVAALVIHHFVVRPKISEAQDLSLTYQGQVGYIERGEQDIQSNREQVEQAIGRMSATRDEMLRQIGIDDAKQSHQLIQHHAAANGLTITRIEPMRSVIKDTTPGPGQESARIETKEFRVECRGSFHSVLEFIDLVQSGPRLGEVKSFRMIPIDGESVRAAFQIELIELAQHPELLGQSFSAVESGS